MSPLGYAIRGHINQVPQGQTGFGIHWFTIEHIRYTSLFSRVAHENGLQVVFQQLHQLIVYPSILHQKS